MLRRMFLTSGVALTALAAGLLVPATASADDTYDLRVVVLSPSGEPVPGVVVFSEQAPVDGRTDANGRAVFHGLGPSELPSPGICTGLDPDTQHLAGPTGWVPFCRVAPAPVDGVSRMTLRFTLGAAVSGTLLDARTGAALAGASVTHVEGSTGSFVSEETDAYGRYLVPNLPAGDYGGPFTGGTAPTTQAPHGYELVTLGGDGVVPHRAGRVTDLGVARLRPLVQVDGTVTDTTGQGVEDQPVRIDDLDGDPGTHTEGGYPSGLTGGGGGFSVSIPWSPTPYRQLCAWSTAATTARPAGLGLRCVTSRAAGLTITQNVVLAAGGAVRGSIAGLAPGQTADPEVVVRVNGEDVVIYGLPTARVYRIGGLPAGTRVVTVTTSSGTSTSKPVVVRTDQTTAVPVITVG